MKTKRCLIKSIVALITLLVGLCVSGCTNLDPYVKPNEIALFRVYLQVVDSETNKPVEVILWKAPKLLIKEKMKNEKVVSLPLWVESPGQGIIEATWVDLKESKETFSIRAIGYPVTQVPLRYRAQIQEANFSSGSSEGPAKLKLSKSNKAEVATP